MNRIILIVTLALFGALTAVALWVDGVFGIFASIFHSYGSMQIYVDLVIALTLVVIWIYRDANKAGRNPWPWIIATFVVGAFSPLVYLLVRESSDE
ncbi:MAG: DUF2834 domain-containing protein [Anaerolineae bacterium]